MLPAPLHHRRRPLPHALRLLPALALLALALPVRAQLLGGVPQVHLPPVAPLVERVAQTPRQLQARVADPLVRRLPRQHPELVALDPAGAAILRDEVVAIDPRPEALEAARAPGLDIAAQPERQGPALPRGLLRPPRGVGTAPPPP